MVKRDKTNTDRIKGLRATFRALRHRNYRLFFGGQGVSLIGTWIQQIAMSWLVYRLTSSPLLLGVVGFATQIATSILAPFAGVLTDRWDRRKILIATQTLSMAQAFVLAILALSGLVNVWHIVFLGLCLGFINGFDMPARHSFVVEMIEDREDLGNAIALNSSIFNGARLVGPSIAGILIAVVGEGWCFFLNGLSFLAVVFALLAMRINQKREIAQNPDVLHGLKEGLIYVFRFTPIRSILLLLSVVSLMGMPFTVLMPVFARDILHGGAYTFGFLVGASGLGALTGAIYLASRKSVLGLGRLIAIASGLFGIGLIALSQSRVVWLSLLMLFVAGFGMMVAMASCNTILQTIVDDDKRGRVMSLYVMTFMGMAPLGSLLAGGLAAKIGTPETILIGGASCILGSLMFARKLPALREIVRPIYVRMGIIPEVVTGIESTAELSTFEK